MIGMIIPPAQIKERAEKTAEYAANNGEEFEKLLFEKEKTNPKFIFLHKESPYRPYYDYMINEHRKQLLKQAEEKQAELNQEAVQQATDEVKAEDVVPMSVEAQQRSFLEQAFQDIKAPDPQKFYAEVPQKLTLAEKEFIQHTAQYVAKNGKNFLMPLSDREKNNPQYEFLKPGSDNFTYFTALVDGYTKILNFTAQDLDRLQTIANDREYILSKCLEKFEYEKRQQQSKLKKVDNDKEKEVNIDWNDFELVETIVFDDDNLIRDSTSIRDELRDMLRRRGGYESNPEKPIEQIITATKKKQVLQKCSVCDRHIPASGMNHHLALCMLDPKAKERKKQQQKQPQVSLDISQNLKSFEANRPDIFGPTDATAEADKPQQNKVIWDGQASNMTRTTATVVMMENQQKKLLEQMRNEAKKK